MDPLQLFMASGLAYFLGWFFTGAGMVEVGIYELKKDAGATHLILGGAVFLAGLFLLMHR